MGQLTSRQETIGLETSNPYMRNWLCANIAIRETSKVLAVWVHREISRTHKIMRQSIGALPLCHANCSRTDDGSPWCATCDRWKREIMSLCESHYKSRINWTRVNSSQWPINPYEMGRVYIPKAHRLYYKCTEFHEDLRFLLSFIENFSLIQIPKTLCERVWLSWGRVRRKNIRMRLRNNELETIISVMVELLSQKEFGDNEEVINKLQTLFTESEEEIESCSVM